MWRAVIFRSLKGGRREDENKKKLEEGHKCDNSCRLYNLCCFSGRYGKKKKKVKSFATFRFLSAANQLLAHNNQKRNGKRICKMDG